jgi:hypothetical protein
MQPSSGHSGMAAGTSKLVYRVHGHVRFVEKMAKSGTWQSALAAADLGPKAPLTLGLDLGHVGLVCDREPAAGDVLDVVRVEGRRRRVRAGVVALADVTSGREVSRETIGCTRRHLPRVRGVEVGGALVARELASRSTAGRELEEVASVGRVVEMTVLGTP